MSLPLSAPTPTPAPAPSYGCRCGEIDNNPSSSAPKYVSPYELISFEQALLTVFKKIDEIHAPATPHISPSHSLTHAHSHSHTISHSRPSSPSFFSHHHSNLTPPSLRVSLHECAQSSYVSAVDLIAQEPFPPFRASTMDGYAFNSSCLKKFSSFFLIEKIFAKSFSSSHPESILTTRSSLRLSDIDLTSLPVCAYITTGAPVPDFADIVIPIEVTRKLINESSPSLSNDSQSSNHDPSDSHQDPTHQTNLYQSKASALFQQLSPSDRSCLIALIDSPESDVSVSADQRIL
jgi:hypothetical protein